MTPAQPHRSMRLVREVSRSFYLTLRILPAQVRQPISLAYLWARTTDTIADTNLVPLEQRLAALQAVRDRIAGRRQPPLDFTDFTRQHEASAERTLLLQCEPSLGLLNTLPSADRQQVVEVLDTIISGQTLDLTRFGHASAEGVVALATDDELEDYIYRVAGCVGAFWTKLCRAHLFPHAPLDETALLADAVRLGKGLQLVNLLRDLPADLRQGRCYLPADLLAQQGLTAADLLMPQHEPQFRPVYDRYLDRAQTYLAAGWAYTNALPRRLIRLRLACAWPVLIGTETLARLRAARVLEQHPRIKVSRAEVRRIIVRSVVRYPWPAAWHRLFPPHN